MAQAIKRGILQSFDNSTYTASVLIIEAGSCALSGVPVSTAIDGTSALVGALCAVLFFDEQNYSDAVIIACYPNDTQGVPNPPPGRVTFVTPTQQLTNQVINSGLTSTYTIVGGNIPSGALAVLFKAYFTSATAPAHIDLAAHGGNLSGTCTIGEVVNTTQKLNGIGICPLDALGQIDIRAVGGNCTVNFITYGYII